MPQVVESEVRNIVLSNSSFGPSEIDQLMQAVGRDYSQFGVLRDSVSDLERQDRTPAMAARLGVCQYLLGRFQDAAHTLAKADGGALAYYYLGKSQAALGQFDAALASYKSAKVAGYDKDLCALAVSEAQRSAGKATESLATLDGLSGAIEQTAEYLFQRAATVSAISGSNREVIALYERAVGTRTNHVGALFGLAMENDRHGNDDEALRLYETAANCFPCHVGVLLNLGLLYEDRGQYESAQQCYRRILDSYPSHGRAALYLKDAAASGSLFDEDAQKRQDRLSQVLGIPVSDFELSVRSRNCLQKMGIRTLGDLAATTEAELMASKNFGETSLNEIKDMLASKGLTLGQMAHERIPTEAPADVSHLSPDEQVVLDRPIADLNLSVRARKCMVRLGLQSIGELIRKTADDLLECKNFGVTSLNEVREKLTAMGLKLRGD